MTEQGDVYESWVPLPGGKRHLFVQCPRTLTEEDWSYLSNLFAVAKPSFVTQVAKCACWPDCGNDACQTEHSPYMDAYCDDCTATRCDVSFNVHTPAWAVGGSQ